MIRQNPAVKHFEFDTEPATPAEEAIQAALSARLKEIADKPITARTLVEMEQFSSIAREMLIVGKAPGQARRRSSFYNGPELMGGAYVYDGMGVMAPSSGQENFGMTAIREGTSMVGQLIAIASQIVERFGESETVKALAVARKEGLADVASALEARLLDSKKATAASAAKTLLTAPQVDDAQDVATDEANGVAASVLAAEGVI